MGPPVHPPEKMEEAPVHSKGWARFLGFCFKTIFQWHRPLQKIRQCGYAMDIPRQTTKKYKNKYNVRTKTIQK